MVECLSRDPGFEPHGRHCVVSLSKNIDPSLVLVQPRKTCPFITERLLMGPDVKNQIKISKHPVIYRLFMKLYIVPVNQWYNFIMDFLVLCWEKL